MPGSRTRNATPFSDRRCAWPAGLQFAPSALPRRRASRQRFSNRNGRLSQPARNVALALPEPMSPARIAWSHESDSNRRPAVYETAALPAELSWPGQSRRYRFIYASTFARSSIRPTAGRPACRRRGPPNQANRRHGSKGAMDRCGPVGARGARDRTKAPPSVGQAERIQQWRLGRESSAPRLAAPQVRPFQLERSRCLEAGHRGSGRGRCRVTFQGWPVAFRKRPQCSWAPAFGRPRSDSKYANHIVCNCRL